MFPTFKYSINSVTRNFFSNEISHRIHFTKWFDFVKKIVQTIFEGLWVQVFKLCLIQINFFNNIQHNISFMKKNNNLT